MYKYIFFDLDGTLTEPAEGICNSFAYAFSKFGIYTEDKSKYFRFIGPPLYNSFAEYGLNEEQISEAIVHYRQYFNEKGKFENSVYPGVKEMLGELKRKGKTLVVATSKYELFAGQILEHFGLAEYFDFVAGASKDESRSEKPDVIQYAIDSLGISNPSETVMIGDRFYDILGGKECGLATIGVLYGYGSREEFENAGADYIAETVEDIASLI